MEILDRSLRYVMSLLWRTQYFLPPIQNDLLLIPAHELAAKIRNKEVKSEHVVQAYIERIKSVNVILNAVVDERFDLALKEAKEVDQLITSGVKTEEELEKESPLLGVPITIKEHIAVKGLHWTAGIVARKDIIADTDSLVVHHIKAAGAIILGVTNTPELCADWSNCVNCVYGRTLNPYDTRRISGGSSGGEGSILSAAGSLIGIGSDLGGSIRFPSMFNGIFGHKPTWGMFSNEIIFPVLDETVSKHLTLGPMCRYATDLKLVMKAMFGNDRNQLKLDETVSLEKIKFFYIEEIPDCHYVHPVDKEIKDAHKKVTKYLEEKFNVKVEKPYVQLLRNSFSMLYEAVLNDNQALKNSLRAWEPQMNMYMESLKWMLNKSSHTFSFLTLLYADRFIPALSATNRADIKKKCTRLREELQQLLGEDGVLLYPTLPMTALYHSESFSHVFDIVYSGIFNVLGFPATHCPLGLSSEGLPLGIQVISSLYNDHLCLAVAEELERGFGGWIAPSH